MTGLVPGVWTRHACCRRRPFSENAIVCEKSATKSQVLPPLRQTASAVKIPPPPVEIDCSSPPLTGPAPPLPFSRFEIEEPELAVLTALGRQPAAEQRRRGRAEIDITGVQVALVGRRPVLEEPTRVGREHEDAVAPVRPAVPLRVTRGNEEVAGRRLDDDARASPDRGVALRAGRRLDQLVPVATERVPDVDDPAGLRRDRDDVALIRRRVADVAAGPDQHQAARIVERRRDLFPLGELRDRDRPARLLPAVRE